MIRIVCNRFPFHCAIYEIQVNGRNGWVTVATFNSLIEGVKKYGMAILDEYDMISNRMTE